MLSFPASKLLPVSTGQLNIKIVNNLVKSSQTFVQISTPLLTNCTSLAILCNFPKPQCLRL